MIINNKINKKPIANNCLENITLFSNTFNYNLSTISYNEKVC